MERFRCALFFERKGEKFPRLVTETLHRLTRNSVTPDREKSDFRAGSVDFLGGGQTRGCVSGQRRGQIDYGDGCRHHYFLSVLVKIGATIDHQGLPRDKAGVASGEKGDGPDNVGGDHVS